MVDWSDAGGIAAVVSAMYLPFILSPTAYGALQKSSRWLIARVWPSTSECGHLSWDDIPDGKLHDCQMRLSPYRNLSDCYCGARKLEHIFNKAMAVPGNRSKSVVKPAQLALDRHYVYTDIHTLLALILLTTDGTPSFSAISVKDMGDLAVARIRELGSVRQDLTKKTVEGIIAGYPPWYHEHLEIAHGPIVPHPIKTEDDLYRAGWVIAVGLSHTPPHASAASRCNFMNQPVKRVLRKLRDEIQPHFQQNATLQAAVSALGYMIRSQTGSGVEHYLTPNLLANIGTNGSTVSLSGSDCIFAMSLFNEVGPLSDSDKINLGAMLEPVIIAAVRGSHEVVQEFKNQSEGFRIPSRLQDLRRPVYLDLGK